MHGYRIKKNDKEQFVMGADNNSQYMIIHIAQTSDGTPTNIHCSAIRKEPDQIPEHVQWPDVEMTLGDKIIIEATSDPDTLKPEIAPGSGKPQNMVTDDSCSFCGRSPSEVKHMFPSRDNVRICDKCVDLCNQSISEMEINS